MHTYGNAYTMHLLSHIHAHTQTQTYTAQKNLNMLGYVKRFSQNITGAMKEIIHKMILENNQLLT